ncbi:MAG: SagB family peptide dehydrogenase [Methylovulum sp.]|nr:SagB family peptide dehydrogenase [Methylovulum sp.]
MTAYPFVFSLKSATTFYAEGDDLIFPVQGSSQGLRWRSPTQGWRKTLACLAADGADLDGIARILQSQDGSVDWAKLHYLLGRLDAKGLLSRSVPGNGTVLATLLPMTVRFRFALPKLSPDSHYRLSRFVSLRPEQGQWLLETPLSPAKLWLHDGQALPLVACLAQPTSLDTLCRAVPNCKPDKALAVLALLVAAGAAAPCDAVGQLPEDGNIALRQWESVDLLFHSRSRPGRHDGLCGATFRFLGQIDPLPALKPLAADAGLPLPIPDMARIQQQDPPFAAVVENRRSIRDYTGRELDLALLSEFLFRAARVKAQTDADSPSRPYPITQRPYPNGGALYELELYLSVGACTGLTAGLYHYEPLGHRLLPISGLTTDVQQLLDNARLNSGAATQPPVLLTLVARCQRPAWKYQGMAYALMLKNTGVLYHQLYLAATVMGLAPCGLGMGDSDLFAEAARLDYYQETAVGEFMLGGRLSGDLGS